MKIETKSLIFYLMGSIVVGVVVGVVNIFITLDMITNVLIGACSGFILLMIKERR